MSIWLIAKRWPYNTIINLDFEDNFKFALKYKLDLTFVLHHLCRVDSI